MEKNRSSFRTYIKQKLLEEHSIYINGKQLEVFMKLFFNNDPVKVIDKASLYKDKDMFERFVDFINTNTQIPLFKNENV